jgi:hypothetical protein
MYQEWTGKCIVFEQSCEFGTDGSESGRIIRKGLDCIVAISLIMSVVTGALMRIVHSPRRI